MQKILSITPFTDLFPEISHGNYQQLLYRLLGTNSILFFSSLLDKYSLFSCQADSLLRIPPLEKGEIETRGLLFYLP